MQAMIHRNVFGPLAIASHHLDQEHEMKWIRKCFAHNAEQFVQLLFECVHDCIPFGLAEGERCPRRRHSAERSLCGNQPRGQCVRTPQASATTANNPSSISLLAVVDIPLVLRRWSKALSKHIQSMVSKSAHIEGLFNSTYDSKSATQTASDSALRTNSVSRFSHSRMA